MDSVCDRQLFARELASSRTAHLGMRENGAVNAIRCQGSPFSAVRFGEQKSQKMGIIRESQGKPRREFSAVQTVWRRGRDSNPRYPFGYAGFQDRCHQPLGHLSGPFSFTISLAFSNPLFQIPSAPIDNRLVSPFILYTGSPRAAA
jgi:hypothetical protein